MKHPTTTLLLAALCLPACAASPRPELKIASAMEAFQDSVETFMEARRTILRERQSNLQSMAERAMKTRQDVERKQGLWRVLKDKDRLDVFDSIVKEADATLEAHKELVKLRLQEPSMQPDDAETQIDREKIADVINELYLMGTGETSETQINEYFRYLTGVANQIAAKQPRRAR
jgi:hypothetical protein